MRSIVRTIALGLAISTAASLSLVSAKPMATGNTRHRASAGPIVVPKGTDVVLVFDQSLTSKSARIGQPIRLHVRDNVRVSGRTVLTRGTRVTGVISKVEKRGRYGVNAKMKIALDPVRSAFGERLTLEPRSKGSNIGQNSGKAAGATAGGAVVLGPVGLVGGYFVHGKQTNVSVGDLLPTQVSKDTVLRP
jgi:hypothetical protein